MLYVKFEEDKIIMIGVESSMVFLIRNITKATSFLPMDYKGDKDDSILSTWHGGVLL